MVVKKSILGFLQTYDVLKCGRILGGDTEKKQRP
jgi:hypothetical protein